MTAPTPAADEDRLADILDQYFVALEAGNAPSKSELLRRHPELRDELLECLTSLDFLHGADLQPLTESRLSGNVVPEKFSDTDVGDDGTRAGVLGDFRLGKEVGRGGMGVVYEAEQISLNRRVALKVLPFAAVLDGKQLRRFKNEAQLAAQLHHTNIVPVFAVGSDRGVHYYAMQFIDGQTLAEVIHDLRREAGLEQPGQPSSQGFDRQQDRALSQQFAHAVARLDATQAETLPVPAAPPSLMVAAELSGSQPQPLASEVTSSAVLASMTTEHSARSAEYFRMVARLGMQVAEALEHAHDMGIIHRDVKPSNLLLDLKGKIWITDFGLAQVQTDLGLTMTGDLVGTIRYMSPEQAMAKRVPLDYRTDIYSLGVTLYELLGLQPAFPGTDRHEVLRRVAFDDPPSLRKINHAIPVELETIVLKAIMKNPDGRYASARELADDLQRFLQDQPIRARRPSLWDRANKLARRHRTAVRVATFLLMVLMIGSWISLWAIARQKSATDVALLDARDKQRQADILRDQAKDERRVAQAERDRAEKSLVRAEAAESQQARELWKSYLLQARGGRHLRQVGQREHIRQALAAAESLGKTLKLTDDERLTLRNEAIAGQQLIDLTFDRQLPTTPIRRGLDRRLELYCAVSSSGSLEVRRVADDSEVCRLEGLSITLPVIAEFSPDRRLLVLQQPNLEEIQVWHLGSKSELWRTRFASRSAWSVKLSPDGRLLALLSPEATTDIHDLATGRRLHRLKTGWSNGEFAEFSPDSRRLAIICGTVAEPSVQIWDVASESLQATLSKKHLPYTLAWHPSGKSLAAGGSDGRISLWNIETELEETSLSGHQGTVIQVSFHPHEELLASSSWDGSTRLWSLASGQELLRHPNSETHRFSDDGKQIALSMQTKTSLWNLNLARESRVFTTRLPAEGSLSSLSFGGHGSWLVSGSNDGVRLWDVLSGKVIGHIPAPEVTGLWHPTEPYLLTLGRTGLTRRRYEWEAATNSLRFEPPELLSSSAPSRNSLIKTSANGRWVSAVVGPNRALVLDWREPWRRMLLDEHPGLHDTAISSEWAVTSTWHGQGLQLSSLKEGRLIQNLWSEPEVSPIHGEFSADGRWLAGSSGLFVHIWDMTTRQIVLTIPRESSEGLAGSIVFSHDGTVVAIQLSRSQLQLRQVGTWTPLATLETPESTHLGEVSFSRDDQMLAAVSGRMFIRVWDLRLIREQLRTLNLDWPGGSLSLVANALRSSTEPPPRVEFAERPPPPTLPPVRSSLGFARDEQRTTSTKTQPASDPREALDEFTRVIERCDHAGLSDLRFGSLNVVGIDLFALQLAIARVRCEPELIEALTGRSRLLTQNRELTRASADLERLIALDQATPVVCNELAWLTCIGPESIRRPERAVELARSATSRVPAEATYWNTLGVAHYRAGQYEQAVVALHNSLLLSQADPRWELSAFDWYPLAMCFHHLNEPAKARTCLDRAEHWLSTHPDLPAGWPEDVKVLRTEAVELLK